MLNNGEMIFDREFFKEAFKAGYKAAKKLNEDKFSTIQKRGGYDAYWTADRYSKLGYTTDKGSNRITYGGEGGLFNQRIEEPLEILGLDKKLVNYMRPYKRLKAMEEMLWNVRSNKGKYKKSERREFMKCYHDAENNLDLLIDEVIMVNPKNKEQENAKIILLNRLKEYKQILKSVLERNVYNSRLDHDKKMHWDDYTNDQFMKDRRNKTRNQWRLAQKNGRDEDWRMDQNPHLP